MDQPDYLSEDILLNPERRVFPKFDLSRLLDTVFAPTEGCRVCILVDFEEPAKWIKDFAFVGEEQFEVQNNAYRYFYEGLHEGVMSELGMFGGEMLAYRYTYGSNLDLADEVWNTDGECLSLERDVYPKYDIVLCISTWSATAPLTEKCKIHNFRGATMHGMNDIILNSGLAVDYQEVSGSSG